MQKCTRFAFYSIKLKKWGARNKLLPFLLTNHYKRGKIKVATFKEEEHPRDEKGRFTEKGKSKRKQALRKIRKRLGRKN